MALLAGEGGRSRRREDQNHPGSIRVARDSGLYRKAAELQGGGAAVNWPC